MPCSRNRSASGLPVSASRKMRRISSSVCRFFIVLVRVIPAQNSHSVHSSFRGAGHMDEGKGPIDSYFVIDTRTGKRTTLPSYEAFREMASQLGINPNLETIYS